MQQSGLLNLANTPDHHLHNGEIELDDTYFGGSRIGKRARGALKKVLEFGILERVSYNEVPPRVEYKVTRFGSKFIRILDELEKLQSEIGSEI